MPQQGKEPSTLETIQDLRGIWVLCAIQDLSLAFQDVDGSHGEGGHNLSD